MEEEGGSSSSITESSSSITCTPQDIIIVLDSEFIDFLRPHAINYKELYPHITINLQEVDGSEEIIQELKKNNNGDDEEGNIRWDGAIFPSHNVGSLTEAGVLWDLSKYIEQSQMLQWSEMLPFFRNQNAKYGTSFHPIIPFDGDVLTMYYRKDLFDEYNVPIPRTWKEYTAAAKFFHGKNLAPNGSVLYGSCISRIESCANEYWTSLILSSMTQTLGTSSGFFLDPDTLEPLFGPAMEESLLILSQQHQFGHTSELTGRCFQSNDDFNDGKCALTYNWGSQITRNPISSRIQVGVAPTPGSQTILDRTTNTLQPCTEERCPYGKYYDDIGIVNHAPYSAFGGWAGGISNSTSTERQHATADFFAYVSNSQQSLQDVLPNPRSTFAQPYRYDHVTSSHWVQHGMIGPETAYDYTSSIRDLAASSENSVLELRMPLSTTFRQIVDEEITDYLTQISSTNGDTNHNELRSEVTTQLDERIRDVITTADDKVDTQLLKSYQKSLGYTTNEPDNINNYIDEDYRNAAWGLSGLICIVFVCVMVWIIKERNNRIMKAFQPFLLMQSALGLFLLAGTIIPLGLDDSVVTVDVLNITCMVIPWTYVMGFTIFFSSVYIKIQKCIQIYREPKKNDILVVTMKNAIHMTIRLLCINGAVMAVWTIVDPLRWTRTELDGGIVLEDGTVETYGICMGESWVSLLLVLILLVLNLVFASIATFQAFSCRFLALEYNETQWLPLSIFPFIEVWLIGAPIIALVYDDPTVLFVVISVMITASTICAGLAVFAQKDWYIRQNRYSNQGRKNEKEFPSEVPAGILVLKHPTVECQKQLEEVQNQFEQIHAYNTELEVEIRILKDKWKTLTKSQKHAVAQGLFGVSDTIDSREQVGFEDFDQTGVTKANDAELEAMEQFERVWKMPDEDYEDDNEVSHGGISSSAFPNGLDSTSTFDADGVANADEEATPTAAATGVFLVSRDSSRTRDMTTLSTSEALPASPDSKGIFVYEDRESKDLSTPMSKPSSSREEDPSRIEWFLNSCGDSEDESEGDPEKIMEITNRSLAMAATDGVEGSNSRDGRHQVVATASNRARVTNQLYEHEANVEVASMQDDFTSESESESSEVMFKRKDEKELKSMIRHDDLSALEEKANQLAESLKMKLMNSQLASLSGESESMWSGSKDKGTTPRGLNDLDISKITQEDADTTRSFVVMSDSILVESPARNMIGNGYHSNSRNCSTHGYLGEDQRQPPQRIYYSNDGDSSSSRRRRAGESSAANFAMREGNESPSSSSPTGSITQNAGEPSEGDRRMPNTRNYGERYGRFPGVEPGEAGYDSQGKSQSKTLPAPKTLQFRTDESFNDRQKESSVNKSFSIADWSAVGNTASILQDWSDSHSASSYADSYAESCSSLEATTRASALDTPLANEIDKLVANLDWDGVKTAASKFETSAGEGTPNLSIQEKRRKKRELEAWRTSISRSFSKDPED